MNDVASHTVLYDVAYGDAGEWLSWSVRTCTCNTPWRHR